MKFNEKTKKILKIATVSALALLEIYLIYAAVASMTTYHHHPRFTSTDGQVAQSSGYRSQFFVCLVFAILIPLGTGFLSYMFWFRKPKTVVEKTVAEALGVGEVVSELAATTSTQDRVMQSVESDTDEPSPQTNSIS